MVAQVVAVSSLSITDSHTVKKKSNSHNKPCNESPRSHRLVLTPALAQSGAQTAHKPTSPQATMAMFKVLNALLVILALYSVVWVSRSEVAWSDAQRAVKSDVRNVITGISHVKNGVRCVVKAVQEHGEVSDCLHGILKNLQTSTVSFAKNILASACQYGHEDSTDVDDGITDE